MTVGELKAILNDYDDSKKIYIADPKSRYVYNIDECFEDSKGLASFYGKDKADVLFMFESSQVGSMCSLSDLDLE